MVYYEKIKAMMTVKEVAQLLHIHVNTVRRWSDQGILRSYRITRRGDRRFKEEDIAHFLAEYAEFNSTKDRARKAVEQSPAFRLA
jgi:excisionase family DNA binding protein